jgi:outer membrane protein TolC
MEGTIVSAAVAESEGTQEPESSRRRSCDIGSPHLRAVAMVAAGAALALLAACATYQPKPLDMRPHLVQSLSELKLAADGVERPAVDITKPLALTDIAFLAVENNPDLVAARADHAVGEAEMVQAGLLPNPQFTGGYALLVSGPADFDAWNVGLTQDIKALVTLAATKESARYAARKGDADELWQEWQLISKAGLLYVDIVQGRRMRDSVTEAQELLEQRYARSRRALEQGDVDVTAVAPDISALSDLEKTLAELERQLQSKEHDLNALLGLEPDYTLILANRIEVPAIPPDEIRRLSAELPRRRPDLIALQLGYRSQEAKLRAAVLGQFPALVFGGTASSDTSRVLSAGPSITLDLPIFNRNQGNIAIETATRQKLYDEFNSRNAAALIEIKASLSESALLERQLASLNQKLTQNARTANFAESAFRSGNIDERAYVDLTMTRISKQQEVIATEQLLLEHRIAVAALLGAGLPAVTFPKLEQEPTQ